MRKLFVAGCAAAVLGSLAGGAQSALVSHVAAGAVRSTASAVAGTLPAPAAWVKRLQLDLAKFGFFSGPATGVYGPLTTAAVKRFQTSAGLKANGRWGPASQAALTQKLGGKPAAATTGSTAALPPPSASVKRLQLDLAKLGFFSGPATGVYGPLTTAAVKRFQASAGLTADGRWGPASQAALTQKLGGKPKAATGATAPATSPASVTKLQLDLSKLGFYSGPLTGVYGPLTTVAVKRFQASAGLTADGRWGPASQAALTQKLTRG